MIRTRTLKSALLAGALMASAPPVLTLHLNPALSARDEAPALLVALFLPLWLVATPLLLLVAAVARQVRWWRVPRRSPLPGWPGFTTLALAAGVTVALLYWYNLVQYRDSIASEGARALWLASVAVTLAAATVLGLGVDVILFPRRARVLSAPLAVLASSALVIAPLALRPAPAEIKPPVPLVTAPIEPLRRLILVGMDGLDGRLVADRLARGELPALAALMRRGGHGPLATLRPTEAPPIWATIVTGRLPRDHGVKSYVSYRLRGSAARYELMPRRALVGLLDRAGLVSAHPITHVARRRRALWNALNAFGIDVGIVRLPGTHPVERVRGFMVSDYLHLVPAERLGEALSPMALASEVTAKLTSPDDVDRALLSEFLDAAGVGGPPHGVPWRRDLVERALAPDLTALRAGAVLRAAVDPPFFATYFFGLDVVGHSFLRFAQPEDFGDVSAEDLRRYGRVLDRYTAFLMQYVADQAASLRPREVLLLVSGYGMEPVSLPRRIRSGFLHGGDVSGTHADAPDGFLLAVGDGIREGGLVEGATVLDLAPTMLYLMGLPVARDMEGRVLAELIGESFLRENPVTYIPSYESLAVTPLASADSADLPSAEEGP